jgi:hypothetical protein
MYVYTIYTRPRSVQAQYSRSCPIISCSGYNGSLVAWTVVCLTAAKFKPHIFPVLGFALSNVANILIFMILYDFCLFELCPAYNPSTLSNRRKHRFQQFLYCCVLIRCCGEVARIVSMRTCFVCEARYPVTALVYFRISRSLPSNGSTHYSILPLSFTSIFLYFPFFPSISRSLTFTFY